jgi:putative flavoprotein involved in K+ transport
MRKIETVVVGAGPAGLATSYALKRHGQEHIVLEQAEQPADAWRTERWDSFTLVTPNWLFKIPGAEYSGADPEGFMPR